jgi:hypothetical protein
MSQSLRHSESSTFQSQAEDTGRKGQPIGPWGPSPPLPELSARIYPGCVPFGYRNNSADGTNEVDPVESRIVTRIFDLCASGNHCMKSIAKANLDDFGIRVTEATIYAILHDCFYLGVFEWERHWYSGIHPIFLCSGVVYEAHSILNECNRTGADTDLVVVYADFLVPT